MKRSSKVTLTVVAMMGLAACSRRRDPCESQYFNELACQEAVRSGGYYWGGSWYPMTYHYPYPYYYDSYRSHVAKGGKVFGSSSNSYAKPTVRSGFGSTGSSHSMGS
jgi:hypothetical protein